MTYLIVLFNLKDGVSAADYEAWAQSTDLPTVRSLPSIDGFDLFRLAEVRNSDRPLPYQYVEIIAVGDMAQFGADVATDTMKAVSAAFREFADAPLFIRSDKIGG